MSRPTSVHRRKHAALTLSWTAVGWVALVATACGALDDHAPVHAPRPQCVTVESRLQPLVDLADQGRLKHFADLMAHDVDEASQRALVRLALDIARALPPGSAKQIPLLLADPHATSAIPLIVAILKPLPGDPQAEPPVLPKIAEMSAFSTVARTCLSRELFAGLTELLREPDLSPAFDVLLGQGAGLGPQLQASLKEAGVQGRPGFTALVRDVLTSMAAPGFDPQPLAQALRHLVGPEQPGLLGALALLLERLGRDHLGQPTPERLEAIRQLASCVLRGDPDSRLPGHLYDVLLTSSLLADFGKMPETPLHTAKVMDLMAYATDVLAHEEAARDAMGQVLGLVLRPDIATRAIPELNDLLQSSVLVSILALLSDLVEQPCRQGADS